MSILHIIKDLFKKLMKQIVNNNIEVSYHPEILFMMGLKESKYIEFKENFK